MKYEIIAIFGMDVVDTIEAEDRNEALNKFADKNGLAKNARKDLRWFELRYSYAAAEVGVNTKAKEFVERFIRESLKHVHTPENVGELKALLKS